MSGKSFVLRNNKMELFVGYDDKYKPAFRAPGKGVSVAAQVIHTDDLEDILKDVEKKTEGRVDTVQVA